jgi:hypothetical protein
MTQFFVGGPPLALLVLGTLRVEWSRLPLGIAAFVCFAAGSFLWPFVHTLPLFEMSRGGAAWAIVFAAVAPAVVADGLDWVWAGRARPSVRLVLILALGAAVLWYARPPVMHGPKGIEGIRTMAATRTYLVAALVATVVGALVRHPAARTAAGAVLVATTLADLWGLAPTRNPPLVPSGILDPSRRRMLAERMAADPDRPRALAPIVSELGNGLQRSARSTCSTSCPPCWRCSASPRPIRCRERSSPPRWCGITRSCRDNPGAYPEYRPDRQ